MKSANTEALVQIILKIANLSTEHPEIKELDLNPVIVNEKDAYIVDARLMN